MTTPFVTSGSSITTNVWQLHNVRISTKVVFSKIRIVLLTQKWFS